jgi:hypothetical protein
MAVAMGTQLINACKKGDASLVHSLLGNPEAVKKAGHALRAALEHQHLECAALVLPHAKRMHVDAALGECASQGYLAGVNFLVAAHVVDIQNHNPLLWAAQRGHADCVATLLPHYPAKTLALNSILNETAYYGHVECIRLLIPVVDMVANNSVALAMAAKQGHIDCVKELLTVSNPLTDESYAFTQALKHNHTACVDFLYPVSDAPGVLQRLQETYPNHEFLWKDLEALVLEKERTEPKVKI